MELYAKKISAAFAGHGARLDNSEGCLRIRVGLYEEGSMKAVDVSSCRQHHWLAHRFAPNEEDSQTETYLLSNGVIDCTTVSAG